MHKRVMTAGSDSSDSDSADSLCGSVSPHKDSSFNKNNKNRSSGHGGWTDQAVEWVTAGGTGGAGATARRVVCALLIFGILGVVHAQLKYQHYTRCNSNLIQVILFKKSDLCIQLDYILNTIECVCSTDVLGIVGAATAGMQTVASSAFSGIVAAV